MSRDYRSDAPGSEAANDFAVNYNPSDSTRQAFVFGDECAPYNRVLDGFFITWVPCVTENTNLENSFPPTGGVVWSQFETWTDQKFFDDLPIISDDGVEVVNNKLVAWHPAAGCTEGYNVEILYANIDWRDVSAYYCHGYEHCGEDIDPITFDSTQGMGDESVRWTV